MQTLVEGEREIMKRKLRQKELEIALLRRKIEDGRASDTPMPTAHASDTPMPNTELRSPAYILSDINYF